MEHDKQTHEMSKTEKTGDHVPSSEDQKQNDYVFQKPPPTLATLFHPGNYEIAHEILTHLDMPTFRNLWKAAKKMEEALSHNLSVLPLATLWTCQEHDYQVFPPIPDDDAFSEPTYCSLLHTQACEGFRLKIRAGLAHDELHAICKFHSEQIAKQLPNQWNWNEIWDDDALSGVPFQRIADPADQPSHDCDCGELYGGFILCHPCRYDIRSAYRNEVIQAAEKCAESCEWITRREPEPSDHVLGPKAHYCTTCRENWRGRTEIPYCVKPFEQPEVERDCRIHYSQEAAQVFRCLHCQGGMRGWVICGREGRGGYSKFGLGRKLSSDLPWITYLHPEE